MNCRAALSLRFDPKFPTKHVQAFPHDGQANPRFFHCPSGSKPISESRTIRWISFDSTLSDTSNTRDALRSVAICRASCRTWKRQTEIFSNSSSEIPSDAKAILTLFYAKALCKKRRQPPRDPGAE